MKKKIIGIISCKGGVGKTTLSINLASALNFFFKKKIGLLDADIYGPNHPSMLGIDTQDIDINNKVLHPFTKFNIHSMSMGYFLNKNSSVLLRGPMISNTINFILNKTLWPTDLDYLIIDFPPGTGDIYLTLLRDINFHNIIIITTPQLAAIEDIRRSINMLIKFNIKIDSILENIKYYTCDNCNNKNYIIKDNHNYAQLIKEFNIKTTYELPFDKKITESTTLKMPIIIYDSLCNTSLLFKKIAENILKTT